MGSLKASGWSELRLFFFFPTREKNQDHPPPRFKYLIQLEARLKGEWRCIRVRGELRHV